MSRTIDRRILFFKCFERLPPYVDTRTGSKAPSAMHEVENRRARRARARAYAAREWRLGVGRGMVDRVEAPVDESQWLMHISLSMMHLSLSTARAWVAAMRGRYVPQFDRTTVKWRVVGK